VNSRRRIRQVYWPSDRRAKTYAGNSRNRISVKRYGTDRETDRLSSRRLWSVQTRNQPNVRWTSATMTNNYVPVYRLSLTINVFINVVLVYSHCMLAEYVEQSRVYVTVRCPFVCPIIRPPQAAATGLLMWARRAGDIDRLLHGRAPALSSNCEQVSADVES